MSRGAALSVIVAGVDFSHARLAELMKLADAARPFYDWVEIQAQSIAHNRESLNANLMAFEIEELKQLIENCYRMPLQSTRPVLFDGAGREYAHAKACFHFFSWIIRDAPQQRLQPMIGRAAAGRGIERYRVEAEVIAALCVAYRGAVKTFAWEAVREVICDRLEGSRRAIQGRKKEAVIRSAVAAAVQAYFRANGSYGRFASVSIPPTGFRVGSEEFDVGLNLQDPSGETIERVLFAVKTRETEGGGHSHLFTRDINSAIATARISSPPAWIAVFIIAQSWSAREQEHVQDICDFTVAIQVSPNIFETLGEEAQVELNNFISQVLNGSLVRQSGKRPN